MTLKELEDRVNQNQKIVGRRQQVNCEIVEIEADTAIEGKGKYVLHVIDMKSLGLAEGFNIGHRIIFDETSKRFILAITPKD